MDPRSVLILGHGSRRSRANEEFEALVARHRTRRPDLSIRHVYIELAAPSLAEGLAAVAPTARRVTVLPLFLFAAGHVNGDVPEALRGARERFQHVRFEASACLGVDRTVVSVALDRAAARVPLGGPSAAETVLLVVGRGASEPDANGDFCKVVRLLGEAGGFRWAEPAFIAITGPRFFETAERVARERPTRVLVLPYFLFEGVLVAQLRDETAAFAAAHPDIDVRLADHLGPDERLLDVLDARLAAVDSAASGGPCG